MGSYIDRITLEEMERHKDSLELSILRLYFSDDIYLSLCVDFSDKSVRGSMPAVDVLIKDTSDTIARDIYKSDTVDDFNVAKLVVIKKIISMAKESNLLITWVKFEDF